MAANPSLLQAMTRYSPQVQSQFRRSQYLTDALAAMQVPSENIRSPWELAARLAGVALTNRAANKSQEKLATILRGEKDARMARMLAGLPEAQALSPPAAATQMPAPTPPAVQSPLDLSLPPTPPQPQPTAAPEPAPVADLAWQANVQQESGGNGNAVGRPTEYGRALGSTQMLPATAQAMAQKLGLPWRPELLVGNTREELDYQNQLGRAYFDEGLQRYGGDPYKAAMYYHGGPNEAEWGPKTRAHADAVMAKFQRLGGQAPAQIATPEEADLAYQIMTAGAGADPFSPSAPGSSPPAAGAPPAAQPQAAAGGVPTTYQPTVQEVMLVKRLLQSGDPEEQARGEAMYWKLQERMVQPVEWETTTVNGLPAQVNKTTGQLRILGLPEEARTRTTQGAAGLPPGAVVQEKPTGEQSILYQPPAGYQGAPQQQTYIAGGPADPAAGGNLVANEEKLRGEYNKQVQEYVAAREGYGKVVAAARTGTPAADIAMIFGVMKTLDPTSTVREGEYATVQNSGTIDQTISNIYNRLLTGEGSLTPVQRVQYADMARRQFEVYQKTADALNERYGGLARSYGFDPGRIVRTFDPIEPFAPAQGPGMQPPAVQYPAALNRAHAADVARGLYDPKAPLGSQKRPFLAADDAAVRAVDVPANKGKFVRLPNGDVAEID